MYNGLFSSCDNCAKPLEGKVGTADIKNSYIEIVGNVLTVMFSADKPDGQTYWAKRKDDFTHLHFCNNNGQCFGEYLTNKAAFLDNMRKEKQNGFDWGKV